MSSSPAFGSFHCVGQQWIRLFLSVTRNTFRLHLSAKGKTFPSYSDSLLCLYGEFQSENLVNFYFYLKTNQLSLTRLASTFKITKVESKWR